MNRKEFLHIIEKSKIEEETVSKIENQYRHQVPQVIKEIVSYSQDSVFFEDGYRTLSVSEILEASTDLHIDFVNQGMIPIIDCGENDFIVYHFEESLWSKFNIIDECTFKKRTSLTDLLQKNFGHKDSSQ